MRSKLAVIGNGMAGVRCVEEIIKLAPDRYDITIIGSEPHTNYNRVMLSKVLQGNTSIADITINDQQWYDDNSVTLYKGETAVKIDVQARIVHTDRGRAVPYDKLIMATGSNPFMLPLPGADKAGVTAFRDIKDCELMMEVSREYKRAVVIGGGLLGLEAARGLLNLGMQVHVVHIHGHLMERQLDQTAAEMLQKELEGQGMKFLLHKQTERILGRKRVEGVQFMDGTRLAVDMVVFAVGIRPNIQLAAQSGIETNRAIVVNDRMETSVPGIYAVGECAEHRGTVYGLVAPLYEQGKVLAKVLCKEETDGYAGSTLYSELKVSGVEVFSAGEIKDAAADATIKHYDGLRGKYKKITVKNNRIAGAVLYGDSSEGTKLLAYIKKAADISVLDEAAAGGSGADAGDFVAEMPNTETVCSCNGVSKGAIVAAVCEQGLQTVEEVRDCTRASSSCGGCKTMVKAILDYTLANGAGEAAQREPICACTSVSHEEAKETIHAWLSARRDEAGFVTEEALMARLGWSNPAGCATCRPAIRYYAARSIGGSAAEATGAHVRSLADGSYAVQPRTYGGVATPELLRLVADAAERLQAPLVKLTGEARLQLLGLTERQAALAAELFGGGQQERALLVGARAYEAGAKPPPPGLFVASVTTCDGLDYEPGALRDSVRLGAWLERELEHVAFPAELAARVSASPLHRAGTLTADLGLVGAPGGWELYAGGSDGSRRPGASAGGAKVRPAELVCTELDDRQAIDYALALLQWYRMSADYGQTLDEWLDGIGVVALRERLFDLAHRQLLLAELGESLRIAQTRYETVAGVTGDE